jgi:hypothetical protein
MPSMTFWFKNGRRVNWAPQGIRKIVRWEIKERIEVVNEQTIEWVNK